MINTIPCSPSEIERILDEAYKLREALFLWGEPGVEKSDNLWGRRKSALAAALRCSLLFQSAAFF